MHRIIPGVVSLSLISGCAGTSVQAPKDPAQSIASVEAAYTVAANAETAYIGSAHKDPAVVAHMKAYDQKAYDALLPLRTAAESGNSVVDAAEIEAALAAVQSLTGFMGSRGIR